VLDVVSVVGCTLWLMTITIECTCGEVSFTSRNPLRALAVGQRLDVLSAATADQAHRFSLELDAAWHPTSREPDLDCVVYAELDRAAVVTGLSDDEAAAVLGALVEPHEYVTAA
jgi:hypothetical protein